MSLWNLKYKVWVCWLYISILHYFIALVKFPIKVHCNVVHLFYFQIVFLFTFVTDLTMYTFFFPYSMFLLSNIWVLIVETMHCQNRGQWFMSRSHNSPSINNSNYGNDNMVFRSLYLSWLCMTFILLIYFIVFLKFNNLCNYFVDKKLFLSVITFPSNYFSNSFFALKSLLNWYRYGHGMVFTSWVTHLLPLKWEEN